MKYHTFHATWEDLAPRLQLIEERFQLKYIPMGWQQSPSGDVYSSVFDIPNLGVAKYDRFILNEGFLVAPIETPFVVEAVPQHTGRISYLVAPDANPEIFIFYPGGVSGEERLIGGCFAINSHNPAIRKICFQFSQMLLKGFEDVKDYYHHTWWVGPQAMDMLLSGKSLVTDGYWFLTLPVDSRFEAEGREVHIHTSHDMETIHPVVTAAFQRSQEADLVEALYRNGHLHLSLIAEIEGRVVGYIGFSPVTIEGNTRTFRGVGLGPLAVLPAFQRIGIGSALVETGMEAMFRQGRQFVVVLGDPTFYARFGFESSARHGIRWERDVPPELFQIKGRDRTALDGVRGIVSYMPELDSV